MVSSGPVPHDLHGVERTALTASDIEDLRVGAWILGTGGGGDPYFGYLCLKQLYAQGRVVDVIDPVDLPDDAYVAAVNQMGSPLPAEERLTDPAKVTRIALQNASSIAALLLTTETLVTDIPEKEPPPAPGGYGGGGMGGMGGMM